MNINELREKIRQVDIEEDEFCDMTYESDRMFEYFEDVLSRIIHKKNPGSLMTVKLYEVDELGDYADEMNDYVHEIVSKLFEMADNIMGPKVVYQIYLHLDEPDSNGNTEVLYDEREFDAREDAINAIWESEKWKKPSERLNLYVRKTEKGE